MENKRRFDTIYGGILIFWPILLALVFFLLSLNLFFSLHTSGQSKKIYSSNTLGIEKQKMDTEKSFKTTSLNLDGQKNLNRCKPDPKTRIVYIQDETSICFANEFGTLEKITSTDTLEKNGMKPLKFTRVGITPDGRLIVFLGENKDQTFSCYIQQH